MITKWNNEIDYKIDILIYLDYTDRQNKTSLICTKICNIDSIKLRKFIISHVKFKNICFRFITYNINKTLCKGCINSQE